MLTSALINYTLGFVTTVTLMSNLGDIKAALNDPSRQPYVAVIYELTKSKGATIVLVVIMIIMVNGRLAVSTRSITADEEVLFLRRQSSNHLLATGFRFRQRQGRSPITLPPHCLY